MSLLNEIKQLAMIIDPTAFLEENSSMNWRLPKNVFWEEKRLEALKIATRVIIAGYKRVEG